MYTRYWITFKNPPRFSPLGLGCGVTAESEEAAIELIRHHVFKGDAFEVLNIIENVAIPELDQGHVVPNMGNFFMRGIWWPIGYTHSLGWDIMRPMDP